MVAIKDFEMPKKCIWDCPFCNGEGGACELADIKTSDINRPLDCPLVEVDYEARLKADMLTMMEELKEQLREIHEDFFETEHFDEAYGVSNSIDVIQQKIDALKESENG